MLKKKSERINRLIILFQPCKKICLSVQTKRLFAFSCCIIYLFTTQNRVSCCVCVCKYVCVCVRVTTCMYVHMTHDT